MSNLGRPAAFDGPGAIMRILPSLICLSLLAWPASGRAQADGFRTLFDGESLAGWEGSPDAFRVVDGAIVAGTLEAEILADEFLCTTEEFDDFELRLEARVTAGQIAGVQFRGRRVSGSTQVAGYQADMGFLPGEWIPRLSDVTDIVTEEPYPLWGSLLDEYRPQASRYPDPTAPYWLIAVADRAVVDSVLRPGDWNSVTIVARGPAIEIRLNGKKTIDYTERDEVPRRGVICVQIHSGPPSQAFYRDILIRRISR